MIVDMSDGFRVASALMGTGIRAGWHAAAVVRRHTQLLVTRVQGHASGRPGPNAETGDYRRSIAGVVVAEPEGLTGYAGTNRPQGRRLEGGFYQMTDRLGRYFEQPPYPHFGPALDETEPGFVSDMAAIVGLE